MKTNTINFKLQSLLIPSLLSLVVILSSCSDDEPAKEPTPEVITRVQLTFTPMAGEPLVFIANDPDGDGVANLEIDPIVLSKSTMYHLEVDLFNGLVGSNDPGYDIGTEVEEEGDEHMFFFAWTEGFFTEPAGNGNLDSRSDAVLYEDEDVNGLPLGLATAWTTKATAGTGTFRIVLKHQPEAKSASSTSQDGETDIDIIFPLTIQ